MTWPASEAGPRRQAELVAVGPVPRIPASPADDWISDGQRVLHFRALIWDRWTQALEVTSGQLLPDQEVPLLRRRTRLSREQAIQIWKQRRADGWTPCAPQWEPPRLLHL